MTDAPEVPDAAHVPSNRRLFGGLALGGVVGAVLLSLLSINPARLPGLALGSPALLYVEKAVACFTAYLLVLVVVVRAFDGDLPSELRGLKWAVHEGRAQAAEGIDGLVDANEALHERIEAIEAVVGISDEE